MERCEVLVHGLGHYAGCVKSFGVMPGRKMGVSGMGQFGAESGPVWRKLLKSQSYLADAFNVGWERYRDAEAGLQLVGVEEQALT